MRPRQLDTPGGVEGEGGQLRPPLRLSRFQVVVAPLGPQAVARAVRVPQPMTNISAARVAAAAATAQPRLRVRAALAAILAGAGVAVAQATPGITAVPVAREQMATCASPHIFEA